MQRNELEISMRSKDFLDQEVSFLSVTRVEFNFDGMSKTIRNINCVYMYFLHNIISSYVSSKVFTEKLISNALFYFYVLSLLQYSGISVSTK